ncbi:hypothetical protein GCM10010440_59740 [Kitasatospora cinereorecta]
MTSLPRQRRLRDGQQFLVRAFASPGHPGRVGRSGEHGVVALALAIARPRGSASGGGRRRAAAQGETGEPAR